MRATFCGREREMELLKAAWGRASKIDNPEPQLIVLMGESGLGKTRIIQEFYRWLSITYDATEPNGYWPEDLGQKENNLNINPAPEDCNNNQLMPYLWWGIRLPDPTARNTTQAGSAINSHLDLLISHLDPVLTRLREVERQVKGGKTLVKAAVDIGLSFIPGAGALGSIKTAAELLYELVTLSRENRGENKQHTIGEIQAEQRKSQADILLNALTTLMAGKSTLTPTATCLLIDDAQFSSGDPSLTAFAEQLITQAFSKKWPLMIIVTHWKAEWHKDWAADKPTIARAIYTRQSYLTKTWQLVDLQPVEDLSPMLMQALPGLLPKQRLALLKRAGGNPRYLDEIIRFCQRQPRHFVDRDLSNPLSDKGFEVCLNQSHSLHQLVQDRFDALPSDVKEAIALASMQGQRFLTSVTAEVAKALGVSNSEMGLNDAEYPHSIVNGVPSGIAEFSQRIFYEVAIDSIDDSMDRDETLNVLKNIIGQRLDDELSSPSADRQQREMTLAVAAELFGAATTLQDQQYAAQAIAELTCMALERYDNITAREMAQRFLAGILANAWSFSTLNFSQLYSVNAALYEMEDFVGSQYVAEAMLESAKKSLLVDPTDKYMQRNLAISWSLVGDIALSLGQIDKAKVSHQNAHEFFGVLASALNLREAYRNLAVSWTKLGAIARMREKNDEANTAFEMAHKIFTAIAIELITPDTRKDLASSWASLGDIALRQGQICRAKTAHQTALQIRERLAAELNTPQARRELAMSFDCVGQIELSLEQIDNAETAFMKALEIRELLASELSNPGAHRDLAVSWDYLGFIAFKLNRIDSAKAAYQKSFEISEALAAETHTPDNLRDLAAAWNNLGQIAREQGQFDSAMAAQQKALALSEQVVALSSTPKVLGELASSWANVGDISLCQGKFGNAKTAYEKAHEIFEMLAADLDTPEARKNLSISWSKLGEIAFRDGKFERAKFSIEKSVEIRELLAFELNRPEAQRDLAELWINLGDIALAQSQYDSTKIAYEKAHEIFEMLAADLGTPEARKELAISWARIGDIARSQDQIATAKIAYQKAHEIFSIQAAELSTPDAYRSLSLSWNMLGDIAHMQGQIDSAITAYQRAIDIDEVLVTKLNTPEAHRDLSALFYRLAILAEKQGSSDDALQGFLNGLVQAQIYRKMVLSPDADQLVGYFENKIQQLKGVEH